MQQARVELARGHDRAGRAGVDAAPAGAAVVAGEGRDRARARGPPAARRAGTTIRAAGESSPVCLPTQPSAGALGPAALEDRAGVGVPERLGAGQQLAHVSAPARAACRASRDGSPRPRRSARCVRAGASRSRSASGLVAERDADHRAPGRAARARVGAAPALAVGGEIGHLAVTAGGEPGLDSARAPRADRPRRCPPRRSPARARVALMRSSAGALHPRFTLSTRGVGSGGLGAGLGLGVASRA